MERKNIVLLAKVATVLGVVPVLIVANEGGADPGHVAGPGEPPEGCAKATCHVGTGNPTRGSGVEVDFGGATSYTPGAKQTWTIRVTGAQANGYGFQVSARTSDGRQAGSFATVDSSVIIICQDGRTKTPTRACNADANVEYPTHSQPRRTPNNSFQVEWTAPATAQGDVRVFVAGNAVNLNGQSTGDRVFLNTFTLTAGSTCPPPRTVSGAQRPAIRTDQPILQAFSNRAALSAGTWIQIFGTNLSPETREWGGCDFREGGTLAPTSLDGVSVKVNGRDAFISYMSPTQINVQAPDDDGVGTVDVEVTNPAGSSRATINKTRVSPALLTTPAFNVGGRQYAAALHVDQVTFVGRANLIAGVPFRPARPGDRIILYAVGCGPTNPVTAAGRVVPDIRNLALPVQVRFGQTVATNQQAFLSPGFVGLCRIDVTVPDTSDGDVALEASVDSVATGQNLFTTIQR
jgi:uncharacterized protein (TIGR03437 family)